MSKQVDTSPKIYFEKPQTLTIVKNIDIMNPVTDIANGSVGNIRTRSMKAMFSAKEIVVTYALGEHPLDNEIDTYLNQQFIHGYGEGAIVARRWAPSLRFMYPHQWGMIVHVHKSCGVAQTGWGPYQVKWFDTNSTESGWAEDLLIIHAALERSLVIDIVEEQGIDTTDARLTMRRECAV